jgi:purine-binding chemotaxis protein CheW
LAGERLGIRVEDVSEVLWAVAVTPLPQAPEIVAGVIDVRGVIVPVLNVRPRFGHQSRPMRLGDRLVLVKSERRRIALLFDGADTVVEVAEEAIEGASSFGTPPPGISGIVKLPDGLVLIHRMESFLSAAEAAVLEEALAAREGSAAE